MPFLKNNQIHDTIDNMTDPRLTGFEIEIIGNDIFLMSHEKDILLEGGAYALRREARRTDEYRSMPDSQRGAELQEKIICDFIVGNIVEYCTEHFNEGIVTKNE